MSPLALTALIFGSMLLLMAVRVPIAASMFAAGAAIALFMPICQARGGNIIVDFFTAKASARTQSTLDRIGAFVLALIFGLLAWRSTLGGLNSHSYGSETQIMGFPEWIVYAFMVPAFVLAGLIALHQAVFGFEVPEDAAGEGAI